MSRRKTELVPIDPIFYEKGSFNLAYLADDLRDNNDTSFLVVLTKTNGQNKTPKLIKFSEDEEENSKVKWKI